MSVSQSDMGRVLKFSQTINQSINQTRQFLTRRNTAKPLQGRKDRWDRLRLTHFHFEWFSVILRLNAHELLAFVYIFVECTLPWQSPIANQVLHKRQRKLIDVSDRRVMIFLTTYFRTTPMADVKLTSLVTDTPIVYSTVRHFKK